MNALKRICVFCGSSPGARPEYARAARHLGALLARKKIGLVFGGGRVGMMGQLAQAALEHGGEVIGVIPRDLYEKKVAFTGLTDLRVVGTMHERKALMAGLADGFMALPGGLGTLEEIFEMLTWAQLGMHASPAACSTSAATSRRCSLFSTRSWPRAFSTRRIASMILTAETPEELLRQFDAYRPVAADKAAWALELEHV